MPERKIKYKQCKTCGEDFRVWNSTVKVCSPQCAALYVKAEAKRKADKEFNKETKRLKQSIKSRSDWLREAQAAFNKYIRLRDKGRPCCSCDKPDNGQHQRHASHFRSVGACSSLRFNTFNTHTSCATCNSIKSGNLIEYRIRLVNKLGSDRVEWLENHNEIVRYDIEYLARLKKVFNKRARLLEKNYERI